MKCKTLKDEIIIDYFFDDLSNSILELYYSTFENEHEVNLVKKIIHYPTIGISLNLCAYQSNHIYGNLIVTHAKLKYQEYSCAILAPIAVSPSYQGYGIGSLLVQKAIEMLKDSNVIDFLFVLGNSNFFSKFGFKTCSSSFVSPPYPVKYSDAWMYLELKSNNITVLKQDTLIPIEPLNNPFLWCD